VVETLERALERRPMRERILDNLVEPGAAERACQDTEAQR
jgi:hypothetical protein